jgi:methylamine dehydrogenase light chain
MRNLDQLAETAVRAFAERTSRRSLFASLGGLLFGVASLPLLPVARAAPGEETGDGLDPNSGQKSPQSSGNAQDPGDPTTCDYWRYCAIDGALCSCCGGSVDACPPGTEMSPITWIGTCRNPADKRQYIISYNDCCGGPACARCNCHRDEGDRPIVRPSSNNEITWCFGTQSQSYTCSTAVILGTALEKQ